MKKESKTPKGVWQRSSKLLGMASKIASKQVGLKFRESFEKQVGKLQEGRLKTQIEQARILTENLGQLKGAAMKAGQILSIDASDLLPPEVIDILSELQKKAAPTRYEDLQNILKEDLDPNLYNKIENFQEIPIASASIGQVHRANIAGKEVVLKIQYPGIADSIDSDVKILKNLVRSFLRMFGKKIEVEATFEELKRVLKQEADYKKELSYLEKFHAFFEKSEDYHTPSAYPDFSTSRILTMSYEEGLTLQDWLLSNPNQESRNKIGEKFLNLFCKEFLDLGVVQTDPNFANFLIRPKDESIVLLDFGASIEYDLEFIKTYQELLKRFSSEDINEVIHCAEEYGFLSAKEGEEAKKAFYEMMKVSFEPFQKENQPFEFNNSDYVKRTRDSARNFSSKLKYSPPPHQLLFLHRKLSGMFHLLKRIDCRMDITPYWKKMTSAPNRH